MGTDEAAVVDPASACTASPSSIASLDHADRDDRKHERSVVMISERGSLLADA